MPKPIYDYSKLSGKIIEVCGTRENFAKQMGIGVGTLSGKLKGKYQFTQDEIYNACLILRITGNEDKEHYFFCLKS